MKARKVGGDWKKYFLKKGVVANKMNTEGHFVAFAEMQVLKPQNIGKIYGTNVFATTSKPQMSVQVTGVEV